MRTLRLKLTFMTIMKMNLNVVYSSCPCSHRSSSNLPNNLSFDIRVEILDNPTTYIDCFDINYCLVFASIPHQYSNLSNFVSHLLGIPACYHVIATIISINRSLTK
uniref:Uncharacterized protein n=1 Tax=Cacopsylla melanoneura TaxID=428564 RepID=A0A8D9ALK3_9HEMI